MIRALVLLAGLLAGTAAAEAHALRVFARVEGATVSGYGFFIGGGRPHGAAWTATMEGTPLASGETDADGRFAFAAPAEVTGAVAVTIDTREGHRATSTLAPQRFAAAAPAAARGDGAGAASSPAAAPTTDAASDEAPMEPSPAPAGLSPEAGPSPEALAGMVERAVAHAVAPLEERIVALDARLKFTDILSGLFLILGLAGMGLWALGRRR
ncbi:hypothetical protein [Acuticoccus yangtzensis]|uniref:hypothetical protein n=1 Tax=Acuticoccus yangtzensis TaxID=1443441 RepID=UPI0009495935|nr:hypothetical protein [Acuticoccus yangtzensis]